MTTTGLLNGELRAHSAARLARRRQQTPFTTIVFCLVLFLVVLTWLMGQRSLHWLHMKEHGTSPVRSLPNSLPGGAADDTVQIAIAIKSSKSRVQPHQSPATASQLITGSTGRDKHTAPATTTSGSSSSNSPGDDAGDIVLDSSKVAQVVQRGAAGAAAAAAAAAAWATGSSDAAAGGGKGAAGAAANATAPITAALAANKNTAEGLAGLYGQGAGTIVFPPHAGKASCPSGVPAPHTASAAVWLPAAAGTPVADFTAWVDSVLALYTAVAPELRGLFHVYIGINGNDPLLARVASKYAYDSLGMVRVVQHQLPEAPASSGSAMPRSSSSSGGGGGIRGRASRPGAAAAAGGGHAQAGGRISAPKQAAAVDGFGDQGAGEQEAAAGGAGRGTAGRRTLLGTLLIAARRFQGSSSSSSSGTSSSSSSGSSASSTTTSASRSLTRRRRMLSSSQQAAGGAAAAAAASIRAGKDTQQLVGGSSSGVAAGPAFTQLEHQHYLMHVGFDCFKYPAVLFLEPGLKLEPDLFGFLAASHWLLTSDPSVYCVSAWNDLGAQAAGAHPLGVLRTDYHPGHMWLIQKEVGRELLGQWQRQQQLRINQKRPGGGRRALRWLHRRLLAIAGGGSEDGDIAAAAAASSEGSQQRRLLAAAGDAGRVGAAAAGAGVVAAKDDSLHLWRQFLRQPGVRKGRQCIIPERPRALPTVPPAALPESAPLPTTADELLDAAKAAALSPNATSPSAAEDSAGPAAQAAAVDVGGEVVAEEGSAGANPTVTGGTAGAPATAGAAAGGGASGGAGAGSSSSSGGGSGGSASAPSGAPQQQWGPVDLSRVAWSDRDLSGLLQQQYAQYMSQLMSHSPDMELAAAAALAPPRRGRVWYSNLVEYAAAVKLLGVGGASWEGGRYCYRLPVVGGAGGSGGRGVEHCQDYMPLTAYHGLVVLRNAQGARVTLVPTSYKALLPSAANLGRPHSSSSGSSKVIPRGPGSGGGQASGKPGSRADGGPKAAAVAAADKKRQAAEHAAAAAKAQAAVKGNRTAAEQVVREMMHEHKVIEQHGGVT